jgi:hypothetical protein
MSSLHSTLPNIEKLPTPTGLDGVGLNSPSSRLKVPVDEASRRSTADTDGTKRRANETQARHRLI